MHVGVLLLLHIVALANVVHIRKTPAAICVHEGFTVPGHVAVDTFAAPCMSLLALVAEWNLALLVLAFLLLVPLLKALRIHVHFSGDIILEW
jgi:hypothetical protein